MTFDDIVTRILDKLNLTSDEARERVGERVNEVYKNVTTSIGMIESRRVETTGTYDPTGASGATLPEITINGIEKLMTVRLQQDGNRPRILRERPYAFVRNNQFDPSHANTPHVYAIMRSNPQTVTILLDAFSSDTPFTLEYEGYGLAGELNGSMTPSFPESFHDVLINGVMSEELLKMGDSNLAGIFMKKYEGRLSDLRFFIAKNQWRNDRQGGVRSWRNGGMRGYTLNDGDSGYY